MRYSLFVDDMQLATGSTSQAINIPAGSTAALPVGVKVDVAQLLSSEMGSAIMALAQNVIGIGAQGVNVKMMLRPSFKVGEYVVESPVEIPLSFTVGKK